MKFYLPFGKTTVRILDSDQSLSTFWAEAHAPKSSCEICDTCEAEHKVYMPTYSEEVRGSIAVLGRTTLLKLGALLLELNRAQRLIEEQSAAARRFKLNKMRIRNAK